MSKFVSTRWLVAALATAALAVEVDSRSAHQRRRRAQRIHITTRLGRKDYIVLGQATGKACAVRSCFFGSCGTTPEVAGEELLDGRARSESLRDVNLNSQANINPILALILGQPNPTGPSGIEIAEKIALFKAIESIPDADAILSPRVDAEVTEDWNPVTQTIKSCVTVRGKAVRVKPD